MGLFTRKEGYRFARVTLTSGLKLVLVYKQISEVGYPTTEHKPEDTCEKLAGHNKITLTTKTKC